MRMDATVVIKLNPCRVFDCICALVRVDRRPNAIVFPDHATLQAANRNAYSARVYDRVRDYGVSHHFERGSIIVNFHNEIRMIAVQSKAE